MKITTVSSRIGFIILSLAILLAYLVTDSATAEEPCVQQWIAVHGPIGTGLNGEVRAMTIFDDGSGPALYLGGYFTSAAGVTVNHIVKWTGTAWQPLISPWGVGLNGPVHALKVHDDPILGPSLVVGGEFTAHGNMAVGRIARWFGSVFEPLSGPSGQGVSGTGVPVVYAIESYRPPAQQPRTLVIGGSFASAGGVTATNVARWNSQSGWQPLARASDGGEGVNNTVLALLSFPSVNGVQELAVGGAFTRAANSSLLVNRIARWNGLTEEWKVLSGSMGNVGVGGVVHTLAYYEDGNPVTGSALYAGGLFTSAGGLTANRIARWVQVFVNDSGVWDPIVTSGVNGVSGSVFTLTPTTVNNQSQLAVGGTFLNAGGQSVNRLAFWNGTDWSAATGPNATGLSLNVFASASLTHNGVTTFFAGGSFSTAGGITTNRVAQWDGEVWSSLTGPTVGTLASYLLENNPTVSAMAVHDDGSGSALYVGGEFISAGGVLANNIARWNGSWSPLSGPNGNGLVGDSLINPAGVLALASADLGGGPLLYAGGYFLSAGGLDTMALASWNGSSWSPIMLFNISGSVVRALAPHDDGNGLALYAGGKFTMAVNMVANNIARWDGSHWSILSGPSGTGINDEIYALTTFDDGSGESLIAAGKFTSAGGVAANRIARWDGTRWWALEGPSGNGTTGPNANVSSLAVYDDGSGPALYAGGQFTNAGGLAVSNIARWDGSEWSPLLTPQGNIFNAAISDLTVFDDGTGSALFATGNFSTVGNLVVRRIARWNGSTWSALSGPNGNGVTGNGYGLSLATFDGVDGPALYMGGVFSNVGGIESHAIARWAACFDVQPCLADLNNDGTLDFFDAQLFLGLFAAGNLAVDFNGDGVLDFFDALLFLAAFSEGCP